MTLRADQADAWSAVALAKLAGWRVKNCTPFHPGPYPGYESSAGKTYAFVRKAPRDEATASARPGKGKGGKGVPGKHLPTGQPYKDAWKQRHKKARRP